MTNKTFISIKSVNDLETLINLNSITKVEIREGEAIIYLIADTQPIKFDAKKFKVQLQNLGAF